MYDAPVGTMESIDIEATGAYGHSSRVFDLQFHPSDPGVLASCSEDGSARVWTYDAGTSSWDQASRVLRACVHSPAPRVIMRSAHLRCMGAAVQAIVMPMGLIRMLRVCWVMGTQVACCSGHTSEVLRVAWSPDGTRLATGTTSLVLIRDVVHQLHLEFYVDLQCITAGLQR